VFQDQQSEEESKDPHNIHKFLDFADTFCFDLPHFEGHKCSKGITLQ